MHEGIHLGERRFPALPRLKLRHGRQPERKLIVGYRHHAALRAVHDGNRLSPVPLTVARPVLHFILDTAFADAVGGQPIDHARDGIRLVIQSVEEIGVYHLPFACIGFFLHIAAPNDRNDVNAELFGKGVIPLIVRRDCHDGARTVPHHHIIRDIDRYFPAVYGIDAPDALQSDAGFFLDQLCPLKLSLFLTRSLIGSHLVHVGNTIRQVRQHRMLRRHNHKSHTEQRVRAGGVNTELLIGAGHAEIDECTAGFSDPVDLLLADVGQVVHIPESLQQFVCVGGDAQIPDVLGLLDDVAVADVAFAALRVLVGQHDLAVRAVVDQGCTAERQPLFKHLEENILRPPVVILLRRINDARPVKGKTDALELLGKLADVAVGQLAGMDAGLDSGVLGRQSESVKSDGKQNIIALHTPLAADNLQSGVCLDMPDVHPHAGRIGEFDQPIEFRLVGSILRLENMRLLPTLLPLALNGGKIVLHGVRPFWCGFSLSVCGYGRTYKNPVSGQRRGQSRGTTLLDAPFSGRRPLIRDHPARHRRSHPV